MSTAATRSTQPVPTLHLACDLGNRIWKLAFATSIAHAPRLRTMAARDLPQLDAEIAAAKARFGLSLDAPVVSCYEAGRDGFWLHRALIARGITSHVVDSASINENRRARRAKSDRLDATALVRLLLRHHGGERGVWSVVHVPSIDEEDHLTPIAHARVLLVRRARRCSGSPRRSRPAGTGCSEGAARRRAALARMECLGCLARRVRGTRPSQHG